MRIGIFCALIFILLLGQEWFAPATAEARKCGGARPCRCGDIVNTDSVLQADLGPCEKRGLTVSSGVTLDCANHTLVGIGEQSQDFGIVLPNNTTGATVRNCRVSRFQRGLRLRQAHHNRIVNSTLQENGDFTAHVGYGIDVAGGSTENLFQENQVLHNADEGIHIGAGSHRNTFIGNLVSDSFRENLYVLRAQENVFRNNTLRQGGTNSLFVKHAAFNRFEHNTFSDSAAVVRGDAHENIFLQNDFVNAPLHFQAYREGGTLTHPSKNAVTGGTLAGAKECLRFSGATGNVVRGVKFGRCATQVSATGAEAAAENTLIGVAPDAEKISLDDQASLSVGWPVEVVVKNANGATLSGVKVEGFDAQNNLLFEALTAADGRIPTQDVIAYRYQGNTRTVYTPVSVRATVDTAEQTRKVTLENSTTITIEFPVGRQ